MHSTLTRGDLEKIPAHCRWQELKDFVRQTALHIRQAVVYDDEHGYPTGMGQIIVKNEDEAWRTFREIFISLLLILLLFSTIY